MKAFPLISSEAEKRHLTFNNCGGRLKFLLQSFIVGTKTSFFFFDFALKFLLVIHTAHFLF